MRIAHIHQEYYPQMGGVAVLMKELCENLAKKGFEIVVYTLDLKEGLANQENINGVLVKRYKPIFGDPTYFPSISFLKSLKYGDFDILHSHNIHSFPTMFASLLKTRRQKLVVQPHYHRFGQTSLRNALFTLYKQVISNLVFKSANAIIVNSSYEEKAVKKDFVHSRNVIKLMQGLPVNEIREFKWCPENPKRILSVGALRRYKNVDRLVIAFNHLLNNSAEDLRLVIIGDGPEKRKIANLVGKMGIAKNVELKHNLSKLQLYSEYSKARVFVSLSYLESFSRTIHEAQIIGVPIVTLEKVIKSGLANELTAIGIESIKPEDISAAISKAISKNPTHSNASNSIVPSINHYANQVAEMYRKLIAN